MNDQLRAIGVISSDLKSRAEAPKQGNEGAPDAWIEIEAWAADALLGIEVGDELMVITWFHRAARDPSAHRPDRGHRRDSRRRPQAAAGMLTAGSHQCSNCATSSRNVRGFTISVAK